MSDDVDDVRLLSRLREHGFAPTALSQWFATQPRRRGLVLGITNALAETLERDAARLRSLIGQERG